MSLRAEAHAPRHGNLQDHDRVNNVGDCGSSPPFRAYVARAPLNDKSVGAALRGGADSVKGQGGQADPPLQVDNPRVGAGLCADPVLVTSNKPSMWS